MAKTPTYSHQQAENFVLAAFKSLGLPAVKDSDTLSDLNFRTNSDLLGLLDAVNNQIPDDAHLLPISVISGWKKVSDVVASVENAPTKQSK